MVALRLSHKILIAILFLGPWPLKSLAQDRASALYYQSTTPAVSQLKNEESYKPLELSQAIEQGLRENPEQKVRNVKTDLVETRWAGTKTAFWFPEVKLVLSTEEQRLTRLRSGQKSSTGIAKNPAGSLGLSLGEYTLFNWGKDYLTYLNQKETYQRSLGNLSQDRRALRHQIIKEYFKLLATKKIEEIKKEFLRQASYVYRLSTQRLAQAQVSKQEYLQARALYLLAQQDYHQAALDYQSADETMAYRLGDAPGTRYVLREALKYQEFKLPSYEVMALAQNSNNDILNAQTQLAIAQRNYEVARKENLPLPKITVDLGAYTHRFGSSSGSTRYETVNGSSDVEVVATVNATWDVWGDDGFFNSRKLAQSHLTHGVAQADLSHYQRSTDWQARQALIKINNYQKQVVILEAASSNIQKTFDSILSNYVNRKTPFLNLSTSLESWAQVNSDLENMKLSHLEQMVSLATVLGIDDFPGESFDKLANKQDK